MGLKPEYKQTEVGEIPEDWEVLKAAQVCELVVDCKNRTPPVVEGGDYAVVRTPNVRDGKFVREDLRFTDEQSYHTWTSRAIPQTSDVLITREAPLGEVCLVPSDLSVCLGQRMMLYRPDKEKTESGFLLYALMATGVRSNLLRKLGGSTVGHAKVDDIRDLQLPIPATLSEQEAIAQALSDADALIESLEQLLAKKRYLKQGAMQELLTGKKRLPGFTGKWEVNSLENITYCLDNLRVPLNDSQRSKRRGDIPYCGANGILDYIDDFLLDDDIILMAEDGGYFDEYLTRPIAYRMKGKCWVNNHAHILKAKEGIDQGFVFYSVVHKNILCFLASGTRAKLNRSELNKIEIPLPPTVEEQTAIAAVLSDMDTEVATLETKLTKARQLKTGMMQELLTGRIRLVRSSASVVPFVVEQQAAVVPSKVHNPQINEAVVLAVLASRFGTEQYPLARVRRTKMMYLLHRHVEHQTTGFLKKAAGPYNPQTRYGGPEKIALKNHYVRAHNNGTYEGFVPADKISQAEEYFEKWYGSSVMEWMEQFRHKRTDELELLATIDMACEDLRREGKATSLSAVKHVLQSNTEWKAKLDKPVFSDQKIDAAIEICQRIFPPEGENA